MPAAARKSFTDSSVKALKSTGHRYTVWDPLLPGHAVRVSAKGKRSFYAVRRRAGETQPTWVFLGVYPAMSLGQGRDKARAALTALAEGHDPAARAEAKRRAEEEAARQREENLFRKVAEFYIRRRLSRLKSGALPTSQIRREILPVWGDRPIASITRRDVTDLIDAVYDNKPLGDKQRKKGGPNAARHTFSAARALFEWACSRDIIGVSPCDHLKAKDLHGSPPSRDRVLSDSELRRVWNAALATPFPFGSMLRVLMISGQRRDEIATMRWAEIDFDRALLTLGRERMKEEVAHTVPLTPVVVEILEGLPRFAGNDYVFAGLKPGKPFSGFSKAKARLDALIGDIAPYTLHDLRRTVRTRLSELGVTPFIGELVIGHTQKGVHAVYDRHRYEIEKRGALERWERRLLDIIVAPEPDNVVALPKSARA
jgi:integrase